MPHTNVPSGASTVSPPGPLKVTLAVRSGAATGRWPVGSRNEKRIRLGPTASSLETIWGSTLGVGPPVGVAEGAADVEQAARTRAATTAAVGIEGWRMIDRVAAGARLRLHGTP